MATDPFQNVTTVDKLTVVQEYLDRSLLRTASRKLVYYQFGEKHPLPGGQGTTMAFSNYRPVPPRITPLVEGARDAGIAAGKALYMDKRSVTIQEYGDYIELSELAGIVSIDPGVKHAMERLGEQMGNSLDIIVMDTVRQGFMRRCAGANGDTDIYGTIKSVTSRLQFTVHFTALSDRWTGGETKAANLFKNATLTVLSQSDTCYAWTVRISANTVPTVPTEGGFDVEMTTYSQDTTYPMYDSTMKYIELPRAPFTDSVVKIVKPTTATKDIALTPRTLDLAKLDLAKALAGPFQDGNYVCIIDPTIELDFMYDTRWTAAATYSNVKLLYQGEIGMWSGIRFVKSDRLAREDYDGVYGETAPLRIATLLGGQAYGVTELQGDGKRITVLSAKDMGQPVPMTSSLGWKTGFGTSILNATFGVNIVAGTTSSTEQTLENSGLKKSVNPMYQGTQDVIPKSAVWQMGMDIVNTIKDITAQQKPSAKPVDEEE